MRQGTWGTMWPARWRLRGASSTHMRRTLYFRPLALALTITMLQLSGLPPGGSVPPAAAASDPCAPSADRIIQDICVDGVPDTTLMQFEQETVNAWLTAHQMPLSDASLIYEYGRSDLRSLIRAAMLARILGIIAKSESDRTAEEQYIFEWFRQKVQEKEVGLYQHAVDDRDSWENDPCHWKPDPDIAEAYGLHYTGGLACSGGFGTLFSAQAQVPQKSYFLTAGLKESYGSKIAASPGGSQVLMQTSEDLLPAIGITVLGASAAALATGILVTAAWATIFGAAAGVAKVVAAVAIGVVAGAVAIVAFAVIVGIIAAFEFSAEQQTLDQLAELDTDLANAQSKFVSLSALAGTQEGITKLTMAFTAETLPEFSSTSTLPAHGSDDALFYVGHGGAPPSTTTAVLTYQDWDGDVWTATPYRGFFVQQGTENGNPVTSFSPVLRIIDPNTGEKLTADLVGTNFLVTRAEPREDQEICPANPFTGVSESDISVCSAYVVSQIDLRDENGDQETVTLASLPSFTSPPTTTFSESVMKTFDVTAAGSPLPAISIDGSLPTGFSVVSGGDTGVLSLSYDGTTPIGVNEYTVTFRATNPRGVATQDFTIKTRIDLEFTSSDSTNFVGGKFGSFLITTSGAPTPQITSNCSAAGSGLTLTDNHDGTATLSGIPNDPAGSNFVCTIQASNTLQTISQQFTVGVVEPPLAQVASASSATFFAGQPNSFDVVTHGAETPVTISFPCPSGSNDMVAPPDWLSLKDHGDGTATLSGTPPVGTEGSFSFFLKVYTLAEHLSVITCGLNEVAPNFTINVSNVPRFLSSNRIEFGPPSNADTFPVITNQASGLISLKGKLPANISFQADENHGSATIGGVLRSEPGAAIRWCCR